METTRIVDSITLGKIWLPIMKHWLRGYSEKYFEPEHCIAGLRICDDFVRDAAHKSLSRDTNFGLWPAEDASELHHEFDFLHPFAAMDKILALCWADGKKWVEVRRGTRLAGETGLMYENLLRGTRMAVDAIVRRMLAGRQVTTQGHAEKQELKMKDWMDDEEEKDQGDEKGNKGDEKEKREDKDKGKGEEREEGEREEGEREEGEREEGEREEGEREEGEREEESGGQWMRAREWE
jgi:hypothetical protein